MKSEGEKIRDEIRQIGLQTLIMMDLELSKFIHTLGFKKKFTGIPKSICHECGKDYRVTHWCDSIDQQKFISNWEKLVRKLFETSITVNRELKEPKKQEEHIRNLKQESKIRIEPRKEQPNNQQLQKDLELERQKKTPPHSPQSHVLQHTYGQNSSNNYSQGKKLTLDSISHLTSNERRVYEDLLEWRNIQAKKEQTKPKIIAQDTMLMAIAYYRTSSVKELMRISGFSERKAMKYGSDIMRIMNHYGMATGIKKPQAKMLTVTPQKPSVNKNLQSKSKKGNGIPKLLGCVVVVIIIVILVVVFR